MREIKFRAWHIKEKKMYWVDRIDWTRDAGGIFYLGVQLPETMRESAAKEYKLMQFTGLKDKNGKPIYEGDIVKSYTHYYGKRKEQISAIKWIEDLKHDGFGEPLAMGYIFRGGEIEVVGNIHENPKLLTGIGGEDE